uniref:Uncharacterized protein n=1 Tax=Arundo donax TaxID=35708 RepID=A0A0A9B4S8_ARUDO
MSFRFDILRLVIVRYVECLLLRRLVAFLLL